MRVLVTGASGFIGRRLCPALVAAGHEVHAMTRHPDDYRGAGTPVYGDVHAPDTLAGALEGCEAAYYLVHSLGDADFERLDAEAARSFAAAASSVALDRIIYLGGLGAENDELSPHLRSRRQVEHLLGGEDVATTTLRAGIIIGRGGITWEMTRQLVQRLPLMVTPRWVHTRTQPIAVSDVIRYLTEVLDVAETAGRTFEIGGPEVLRYSTMLERAAALQDRHPVLVPVPLLSPHLSSYWLSLVTDVDTRTGRSLIDSMSNEVVVTDDSIRDLIAFEPMDYDSAVLATLHDEAGQSQEES